MTRFHALPTGWEALTYDDFLKQRRKLMAGIIRRGFEALGDNAGAAEDVAPKFAAADERSARGR